MEKPVLDKLNPLLKNLPFYQPGRPIEEVARELGIPFDYIIKLASNENPIGPSPLAIEAMEKAIHQVNLYPDGNSYYLKKALSDHLSLPADRLILGNGSNEIIEFIAHAFVRPGMEVVCSQYCFAIYPILTLMMGGKVVEVPAQGLSHDLQAMAAAVTSNTAAVFVANPNNPTGTLASNSELEEFIDAIPPDIPLIIDEAYVEYLEDPADLVSRIRSGTKPNLILMRTFSKIHGLAGLRIGYGVADPDLIKALERIRQPFNINLVAQQAATAALNDPDHLQKSKAVNSEGLEQLTQGLQDLDIQVEKSWCNFVLARIGDAAGAFSHLQKDGIITRPMAGYKLPEWLRISVGTKDQNTRCLESLARFV